MGLISNMRQKIRSWLDRGEEDSVMESRQSGNRVTRRRYRRVAERLTENSSLRDELNDDKAKALLDWGSSYLKKVVDNTADLPDEAADNILEAEAARISGVMRQVNQLTRAINVKDQQQLLDHYRELTQKLDELKETADDIPVTVEEWLSLSEANNDWVRQHLTPLVDGEEE